MKSQNVCIDYYNEVYCLWFKCDDESIYIIVILFLANIEQNLFILQFSFSINFHNYFPFAMITLKWMKPDGVSKNSWCETLLNLNSEGQLKYNIFFKTELKAIGIDAYSLFFILKRHALLILITIDFNWFDLQRIFEWIFECQHKYMHWYCLQSIVHDHRQHLNCLNWMEQIKPNK